MLKLLVVSHVDPLVRKSGQSNRLYALLLDLKRTYRVTLLLINYGNYSPDKFDHLCHEVKFIDPEHSIWHRLIARFYYLNGQKPLNYQLSNVLLSYKNILRHVNPVDFDMVLFEYFYAYKAARRLKKEDKFVICDTHNILWKSYDAFLRNKTYVPRKLRSWLVSRYKRKEIAAWNSFSELFAISRKEETIMKGIVNKSTCVTYVPYKPIIEKHPKLPKKPILVYFGGLRMKQNIDAALFFGNAIKPELDKRLGKDLISYRVVGNKASNKTVSTLEQAGVQVISSPDDPAHFISDAWLAVIPFADDFGFRTRVPELLQMHVDILTSSEGFSLEDIDAAYHSSVHLQSGLNPEEWADKIIEIINDRLPAHFKERLSAES